MAKEKPLPYLLLREFTDTAWRAGIEVSRLIDDEIDNRVISDTMQGLHRSLLLEKFGERRDAAYRLTKVGVAALAVMHEEYGD